MSTIHYDAHELGNIVTCLHTTYTARETLADFFAEVSKVNTDAYNAAYGEKASAYTAKEILACAPIMGGTLNTAISTISMLEYNCDGLMDDAMAAKIGRHAMSLAQALVKRSAHLVEQAKRYESNAREMRAEIADLKAKAVKPKRSRKSAA